MKEVKKRVITNKEQRVAVNIITELMGMIMAECVSEENVQKVIDRFYKEYDLQDDPFTHFPCSYREYADNSKEYERQLMLQRYDY